MKYKKMTEEDIKNQFITPSLENAGWKKKDMKMEYFFTDGEMEIRGNKIKRGKRYKADYLLLYNNTIPLAVIEAKDNKHSVFDGMQQGIDYADILDVPFVYSSNGSGFLEHDMFHGKEKELSLKEFPSPQDLWDRYTIEKNITPQEEPIITEPNYFRPNYKVPRYYQRIAINRTIEAIAKGQDRILLVMATGTGKTFTAFQIVHRLWKSGMKKKILYLADRNILVDQTMRDDFKPFENVMTKIEKHKMDSSYEVYFALYQQLVTENTDKQPFEEFSRDFFDLIIVDECHRGSASEDSQWRTILDYFDTATQIGMTATPKETKGVSNITYFGEPLYEYSLKQGIKDGFLAPYKVLRIGIDKDLEGYRPEKGKIDVNGNCIEDRLYNSVDFDKNIIIDDRTRTVAYKISEFLKNTDRFSKTIVFCVDIDHAERMRNALVNENSDIVAEYPKYIMRITGDNPVGKAHLDYFIAEDERFPTIVTTSKLMTTGVDCKTCKLIVLDNNIQSMTEFKQIIGRGTRLRPDYGKHYFTIMDFRNSTRHFADPDFDGDPVVIYEPEEGEPINFPQNPKEEPETPEDFPGKYRVNDVEVNVVLEENQCYDSEGNLITENLINYSKNNILGEFNTLEQFIKTWNESEKKEAIIDELYEHDVFLDELREAAGNKDMDDFDLICHIAFDKKPLTRAERANNVKKRDYLNKYSPTAKKVIEGLLDKYATDGIENLENLEILKNDPFKEIGSPKKISQVFGGKKELYNAIHNLEKEIYS